MEAKKADLQKFFESRTQEPIEGYRIGRRRKSQKKTRSRFKLGHADQRSCQTSSMMCHLRLGWLAKIAGPIAAIVQDDFYFDMFAALKYEVDTSHVDKWAREGWSRADFSSQQSLEEKIANILKPFDLLNRNASHKATRSSVLVDEVGSSVVRSGMNNWDSTRVGCVDQVLQLIKFAKNKILIKDQYLFDRNVILALLEKKKELPAIDIRIILEPRIAAKPKGMPNLLYLDILAQAGIRVKWKTVNPNPDVAHQNHMKTISADGQSVITGSANKDQTTMYGSFREEQVDIWDVAATKVHDDRFEANWNSEEATSAEFTHFDFEVPQEFKGLDGEVISPGQFIALIRNLVSILFDADQL